MKVLNRLACCALVFRVVLLACVARAATTITYYHNDLTKPLTTAATSFNSTWKTRLD